MEYLDLKTFIFIGVWLLLFFFSFSFSKKNILDELMTLWGCTIDFLLIGGFLLLETRRDMQQDSSSIAITIIGIFVLSILPALVSTLLSFAKTREILKRNPPGTSIFTWQSVIVPLLYWTAAVAGLIKLKMGYVLLFLSFLASLIIYKFFPDDNRINRVAE